ncbi:hypothetical protein TNCV_1155031 [Trichonephila clavipes]|nr:hypothetical protein TNCV_1155031 [Trichonephila clavipes]
MYGNGVSAPNQELQYDFALPSPSVVSTLSSNNKTPDLRSPGRFLRIAFLTWCHRVALMVPTSRKSSNKTLRTSQKTARSTLPAKGVVLNLRRDRDGCFHSIDTAFVSGVKW